MKHGSLFSGIGGFDLAAEWAGWQNMFHCEWNPFGQKVLKHYWPNAISYEDITKTDFTIWRGRIDILTGGFPCQPYGAAGKRLGKEDNATCGPKCLGSFERFNHVGSWAKMFSALLIGTGDWYSRRCKLTWKLKGTKYNRLYFQLQASTLPTNGIGFGLWPTPTAVMTEESPENMRLRVEKNGYQNGTKYGSLLSQVKYSGILPTPNCMDTLPPKEGAAMERIVNGARKGRTAPSNLREYVNPKSWEAYQMLPTPTAEIIKHSHKKEYWDKRIKDGRQEDLSMVIHGHNGMTSQLNPRFVAEMMGFSPNWLELPFQNTETNP